MVIEFQAKEASSINEFDTITTGVYSEDEYISFQRHEEHGHEDDEGIYIEYKDQLYAGEDVVSKVILNRNSLVIYLSEPLFKLSDVSGFEVGLNISDHEYYKLKEGLIFTFWDKVDRLKINA